MNKLNVYRAGDPREKVLCGAVYHATEGLMTRY